MMIRQLTIAMLIFASLRDNSNNQIGVDDLASVTEQGTAKLKFDRRTQVAYRQVHFKHEYRESPLVLLSVTATSDTSHFLVVKAEAFSAKGFQIAGRLLHQTTNQYTAKVSFLIIGVPKNSPTSQPARVKPSESGFIMLDFDVERDHASSQLTFRHHYSEQPVILLTECGTAGTFIAIKADKVTRKGALVRGRLLDHWNETYRARVAYAVFGEVDSEHVESERP
jgi:hypothetical protein